MPRQVNVQLSLPDKNGTRTIWCIGMVFLGVALALNAVATVSLPLAPNVDIVRVKWDLSNSTISTNTTYNITELQVLLSSFLLVFPHGSQPHFLSSITSSGCGMCFFCLIIILVPNEYPSSFTGPTVHAIRRATQHAVLCQVCLHLINTTAVLTTALNSYPRFRLTVDKFRSNPDI